MGPEPQRQARCGTSGSACVASSLRMCSLDSGGRRHSDLCPPRVAVDGPCLAAPCVAGLAELDRTVLVLAPP